MSKTHDLHEFKRLKEVEDHLFWYSETGLFRAPSSLPCQFLGVWDVLFFSEVIPSDALLCRPFGLSAVAVDMERVEDIRAAED